MQLGETICALRQKAGLSQSELADALGVSRQSVSKWETGAAVPDLDRLVKLAALFHVSLDRLVTGEDAPQPEQSAPPEVPAQQPARPARSRAQTAGLVLLCLSAVLAILFAVLMGFWGVLFALPTLIAGLILYFAKKHPVLKMLWAEFLLIDAYLRYATGIRASNIVLSKIWTYQMNYGVLVFSWLLFLTVAALIAGTALVLRRGGWTGGKKQWICLIVSALVLALTFVPVPLTPEFVRAHSALVSVYFVLHDWLRLGAITSLGTWLARWLYTKNAAKRAA